MDERRKRQRAEIHLTVSVEFAGAWHADLHTEDLSMSGMRVFSPVPIPLDSVVAALLLLEEGEAQARIYMQAKVVRSDGEKNGQYQIGLHFLGMDSDSSLHLYRLIRYHLATE